MDVLKELGGTMHRVMGERGLLDVGNGANRTWGERRIVEINAFCCMSEPFNAYMAK